ncbi:hypothetical protein Sm713_22580 [Streptomyces sp. TS71-3]|nr:hypothetical protein Sm713_22580 [Streptomyces sp. TS71-3]
MNTGGSPAKEPNISEWRRRTVGNLTSTFRFGKANDAPVLPDTTGQYQLAQYEVNQLPKPTIRRPTSRYRARSRASARTPPDAHLLMRVS